MEGEAVPLLLSPGVPGTLLLAELSPDVDEDGDVELLHVVFSTLANM